MLKVPSVNLNTYQIDPEALELIPEAIARKYNAIPLAITDGALQVAIAHANDILTLESLAVWTRMRIEPVTASANEVQEAIDRHVHRRRDF